MLQRIRDNASGPLAYVIVALITVVFGVWGIGSYFTPSADPVIATVGHTEITQRQLQQAYDQRYRRLQDMMGDNFDASLFESAQLRRTVLRGLIEQEVMDQHARDAGYRITDETLLAAIRGNPQFQENGRFSQQRYRGLLRQAGIAPALYEERLRQDLVSRQLRQEVVQSAFAAPAEIDRAYQLANQQRRVRYVVFDPSDYRDDVEVSDQEIRAYYDDNPGQFQRPEQVKLFYVSLDRGALESELESPDEQTLRALYEQDQSDFTTPERRSGSWIRVPIAGDGNAARETISQLSDASGDLESRASDVDNARYSTIDAARRQDLPDAVADAMFDLDDGRVSSPIRTDDAWYLLSVASITPAETLSFDDPQVQQRLTSMARSQAAREAFDTKAQRLESLAYEAPNDLQTLADELGLEIRETDWITAEQGPGIGQYDAIRKAAFSDAVLQDELNSTPIQLGNGRRIVLRVAERQPAQQRPLQSVRDDIRSRLVERKATEQARQAADNARQRVVGGGASLGTVAESEPASLQSPGFVGRQTPDLDPAVIEAVFAMPAPDDDDTVYDLSSMRNGSIALIGVDDVREAGMNDGQTPRSQIADRQRGYIGQLEYAVLGNYLRGQTDIEVNEQRLE